MLGQLIQAEGTLEELQQEEEVVVTSEIYALPDWVDSGAELPLLPAGTTGGPAEPQNRPEQHKHFVTLYKSLGLNTDRRVLGTYFIISTKK